MSKDKFIEIKKYPNRRLYNTLESRYITLDDLAEMVREEKNFRVTDSKTQEDVTRLTLVQIILNQELEGYNVLPEELIKQMIKLYNNPMSKTFNEFMINAMQQFNNNFDAYGKNLKIPSDWHEYMTELNTKSAELFTHFFNINSKK